MKLKEYFNYFFKVRRCGGCGEILDCEHASYAFCSKCYLKWRIAKTETCPVCYQSAVECLCAPKGLGRTGAIGLIKLYFYSPAKSGQPQNRLLYRIKRYRNKRLSSFIAGELTPRILSELKVLGLDPDVDVVLANIPRGQSARRMYGFDQSELICREISDKTGIQYLNLLKRSKGSSEQKRLTKDKRFRNVESSFKCTGSVENKYVILFDDVVTTGASMAAGVNLLKKAGAKGVICVCMASTVK